MGHVGEDNIRKLAKMVDGMGKKFRSTVGVCEACLEGKQHRQPSHQLATRAKEPLELIHSDVWAQSTCRHKVEPITISSLPMITPG